jgi:hypothetical protein
MKKCQSIKEILDSGVKAIKADPKERDTIDIRIERAKKAYSNKKNRGATVVSKLREAMWAAANPGEFDNNIHDYSDAMCVVNRLLMKRELVVKSLRIRKERKEAKLKSNQ